MRGSKKSGFGPYATPPKRLRIFETTVRDQEVGGSNPLAPISSNQLHSAERPCPTKAPILGSLGSVEAYEARKASAAGVLSTIFCYRFVTTFAIIRSDWRPK